MIEFQARLSRPGFTLDLAFETRQRAVALFGRSGAGKSTVLGLIAGLLAPDSGRIVVDGQVFVDTQAGRWVAAHRRQVGFVFQDARLFPHLSVQGNLRFGSRARGRPAASGTFDEVVELLGIAPLLDRRPATLSGGERQRVAIGRALLSAPRLLLMDEPLASLDYERKLEILPYLATLRDHFRLPLVYVSHAVEEVARLVDEVVVLDRGRAIAVGSPAEVLATSPRRSVSEAFEAVSILDVRVAGFDEHYGMTDFSHPSGRIAVPGRIGRIGDNHRLLVRAIDVAIAVSRPRDVSVRTLLASEILGIQGDGGALVRVALGLRGGGRLLALVTRRSVDELGLDVGDEVFAMIKATSLDERAISLAPGRMAPGRNRSLPPN
ncbi:MAG: molybdenum ABC transporter ATP-binding protein [Burkholderiaceae bacterium]|nr:molybdenum ABC transporter ATP-binding protein [Burkholderiaceae bacterium]